MTWWHAFGELEDFKQARRNGDKVEEQYSVYEFAAS